MHENVEVALDLLWRETVLKEPKLPVSNNRCLLRSTCFWHVALSFPSAECFSLFLAPPPSASPAEDPATAPTLLDNGHALGIDVHVN